MIPAQNQPGWDELLGGVHPWIPRYFLQALAKVFLSLGVQTPILQVRFSLMVLGLFSVAIAVRSATLLFESLPMAEKDPDRDLVYWLLLSLPAFALPPNDRVAEYPVPDHECRSGLSLLATAIFQSCFLFPSLSCNRLPFSASGGGLRRRAFWSGPRRKNWKHLAGFCLVGAALFVATGLLDVWAGLGFHGRIRTYAGYNLQHSTPSGRCPSMFTSPFSSALACRRLSFLGSAASIGVENTTHCSRVWLIGQSF